MALEGNKPIVELAKQVGGNAFDFLTSGVRSSHAAYSAMDEGKDLVQSIIQGHMKDGVEAGSKFAMENLDLGKVAGSYLLASGGYRLASGGGIYRDKHGNTDTIGVPFI